MRFLAVLLLFPLLLGAAPRGREIYLEGTGTEEITALVGGEGGTEVPASALPCAGCHGRDGRGQAEGGVKPSDLTRIDDDRALKRGIAMGLGADGRQLHVAMPRYRMSQQDMADLISYIKPRGHQTDPGVSETTVRIGTVLPPSLFKPVRETLAARFEEAGELWGRRIELKTLELTGPSKDWPAQVKEFLVKEEIFAVAGAVLDGAFEEMEVPVIGPFTLQPTENRYVFHLSPGLEDQMKALKRFAQEKRLGSPVFFPGSGPEALALLRKSQEEGKRPTLLATGKAADAALLAAPAAFDGRIFVAVPTPLSQEHSSVQLAALAAAEVLLEGLERSGRNLTRDRLIETLESLRAFQTGYGPPVTFGPVRRLGARGAYILKADLKRKAWVPEGGWVEAP